MQRIRVQKWATPALPLQRNRFETLLKVRTSALHEQTMTTAAKLSSMSDELRSLLNGILGFHQ
jgi:hypothetical protein